MVILKVLHAGKHFFSRLISTIKKYKETNLGGCFTFQSGVLLEADYVVGSRKLRSGRVKMLHLDRYPLDPFGLTLSFEFYETTIEIVNCSSPDDIDQSMAYKIFIMGTKVK